MGGVIPDAEGDLEDTQVAHSAQAEAQAGAEDTALLDDPWHIPNEVVGDLTCNFFLRGFHAYLWLTLPLQATTVGAGCC